MATIQPTNALFHQLQPHDNVAMEIENIFNFLIEQLVARRDALLTKLRKINEDYVTKETTREAAVEELERMIRQMQEESIKVNINCKVHEKAIEVYREEMKQHRTATELQQPFFFYSTLNHLQTQIAEFGDVREREQYYTIKKDPFMVLPFDSNIPPPLVQRNSKSQGKSYYFNPSTGATSWKIPESTTPVDRSTKNGISEYFPMIVSSSTRRKIITTKKEISIKQALDPILKKWGYHDVSKVSVQLRYYEFELKSETLAGNAIGKEVFIKTEDSVDVILGGFHPFVNKTSLKAYTQDYINSDGWYLIRESSSGDGQLSVAVTFAKQLVHYKIIFNLTDATYKLASKCFTTLHQLIDNFKYNPIKKTQDGDIFLLYAIPKPDEVQTVVAKFDC